MLKKGVNVTQVLYDNFIWWVDFAVNRHKSRFWYEKPSKCFNRWYRNGQSKYVTRKHRINRKEDARDIRVLEIEANAFWCKLCNKLISALICSFLVASQTAEIRPSRHLGTKANRWIFFTRPYIQNELRRIEINSIKRHLAESSCPILWLTLRTIAFEVVLCLG